LRVFCILDVFAEILFLLCRQPYFGDVELLEDIEDSDHVLVIHFVVALDDNAQIRVVRFELL